MSESTADGLVADVVVIGAGPAGIAAATLIAEQGRRVVLLEENATLGGQIWRHRAGTPPPVDARRWMERLLRSGATILTGTSVVDARRAEGTTGYVVVAEQGVRSLVVSSSSIVLATGARERFLPFPGWTLPGVMGIGGAQALLKSGLAFAGKRVVIAGTGPLLLPVAAALADAGAELALVAEQAPLRAVAAFALGLWRKPRTLREAVRYRARFVRTPYRAGTWVTEARGGAVLEEIVVSDGTVRRTIPCDVLCSAYGLVPNLELARLLGCAISEGAVVVDDGQETNRPHVFCVGETTGIGGMDLALVEGEIAALRATGRDFGRRFTQRRAALRAAASEMERVFTPRAELRAVATPETIVCRCEDVAMSALSPSWTARQAKLYTRVGMGPCQGRVCGPALDFLLGWPADGTRVPTQPALLTTLLADATNPVPPPHHGVHQ